MEEAEKQEILRQARSILGSIKTEKKTATSRANIVHATEARTGSTLTEEHKQKLREAQAARRERERVEREAAAPPAPKRGRGRPKKQEASDGQ